VEVELMSKRTATALALGGLACSLAALPAAEPTAAQRGEKALLTRHFNPPTISLQAYRGVWKFWGDLKEPPADYTKAFMERYGMHPAPYPNGDYPMGLREVKGLLGKSLANDCMICHGGSILGHSYVGLGNSTIDYQALYDEIGKAAGVEVGAPFRFSNVRGTMEAGAMAVWLLQMREPDLQVRSRPLDLEIHDDLCEDVPAWWLLKKKKTMYHSGGGDARSVRSLMQFMLSPLNPPSAFHKEEKTFADIQAYLLTIQPPKYPLPIDRDLAGKGEKLFVQTCSRCHGTYGEKWTYPNRIVPLDVIGTDPARYKGLSDKFGRYYNQSWFAQEKGGWFADEYPGKWTGGYQAPPLDGIWATAPYFHNGSAPTVYHVLKSKSRPKIFTRSYKTGKEDYDPVKLGWKITVLDRPADPKLPAIERRKVYDTTQPGRGNGGHTFGDELTEEERMAVIEYLKTL
jgi:mono/diheme cytochrome c family protein